MQVSVERPVLSLPVKRPARAAEEQGESPGRDDRGEKRRRARAQWYTKREYYRKLAEERPSTNKHRDEGRAQKRADLVGYYEMDCGNKDFF